MSLFAEYSPRPAGDVRPERPSPLVIRGATAADLDRVAALSAARQGQPAASQRELFERTLELVDEGTSIFLVAEVPGEVIAYAKAGVWEPEAGPRMPPPGWYLGGVVVDPAFRRRGIGEALTLVRLVGVGEVSTVVRDIVSAANRASIDLHDRCGFELEARGLEGPGLSFTGGVGLLYRKRLDIYRAPSGSSPT